jgi:tetratricopeptide (TPR) repeat protein
MAEGNVDLAELEMRFAKDPTSDAFIALSAAYLEQGRFMEAMVVAKKGIRSQPENVEGRLLLARVYAGQGKVPKATDEVTALLEIAPKSAEAHFVLGQLHERSGRFEDAIDAFKETLILDRRHEGAISALKAKGIEFNPGPSEEELAAQKAALDAEREAAEAAAAQAAAERAAAEAATQREAEAQSADASPMQAAQRRASARNAIPTPVTGTAAGGGQISSGSGSLPPADAAPYYAAYAGPHAQGGRRLGLGFSFGLFSLLLMAIVGLIFFLRANKAEKEEIAVHAKEAQAGFKTDSTFGLKTALDRYQKILKIDDENEMASSRLAFVYQILVNERGLRELDTDAQKALEHALKFAKKQPFTIGADMWRAASSGKPDEAIARFEELVKDLDSGMNPHPRLAATAGFAYLTRARMNATQGEDGLRKANADIESVKKLIEGFKDSDEPGAHAFASSYWRRLGDDARARIAADAAVRFSPDHDGARVERALIIIESRDLANIGTALDDVSHVLDLGKDNSGPRQRGYATLGRAELRRLADRKDEAQRDLDTAKKALGRDAAAMLLEARWSSAEDKGDAALELLEGARKLDAIRIRIWSALFAASSSDKKRAEAMLPLLKEADILFGESSMLLGEKVDIMRRADKLADVEAMLAERMKRDDSAEVHRELARLAGFKGETDKQLAELKIATEKAEKVSRLVKAEIFTQYGAALAKKGDHAGAIESLTTAVNAAGSYAPALYYLGVSLSATGKTAAAKDAFGRAAKLDPSSNAAKASKREFDKL